jgi:DNA repair exonuclease SbcCD ATPase subunit
VISKRVDQENEDLPTTGAGNFAAFETARLGATPPAAKPEKEEEKVSIFWRVFGGTILSIVALVVITLYNNLTGSVADLRAELSRERDAVSGLVKKEDFDSRSKSLYDRVRGVEGLKVDLEAIKERTATNAAAVEAARKDLGASVDAVKKDTAGLEVLKERVVAVEAVKKDVAGLDGLKDKLTGMAADLKAARDEVQRVQQDLEKNKASDLERKTFRDAQAKQLDETLKELQKGLQDCREKIARLEGALPSSPKGKPQPADGGQ